MIGAPLATGPRGLLLPGQVRPLPLSQLAVPNGLIAYLPLSGDTTDFAQGLTFDASGSGNTGTLNNLTAGSLTQGQVGTALNFNGTSSFVAITSRTWPQLGFSAAMWIKPTSVSATDAIFSIYTNSTIVYHQLFFTSPGVLHGRIATNGTNYLGRSGPSGTLQNNVWQHVAFTWSGTTVRTFVNGVQNDTTADSAGTFTSPNSSPFTPTIGNQAGAAFFSGGVNDVRLYSRALDPLEVATLYRTGVAGRRDAGAPSLPALFVAGSSFINLSAIGRSSAVGRGSISGEIAASGYASSAVRNSAALSGKVAAVAHGASTASARGAVSGKIAVTTTASSRASSRGALSGQIAASAISTSKASSRGALSGAVALLARAAANASSRGVLSGKIAASARGASVATARGTLSGRIAAAALSKSVATARASPITGAFLFAAGALRAMSSGMASPSGKIAASGLAKSGASGRGSIAGSLSAAARGVSRFIARGGVAGGIAASGLAKSGAQARGAMAGTIASSARGTSAATARGTLSGSIAVIALSGTARAMTTARGVLSGSIATAALSSSMSAARSVLSGSIAAAALSSSISAARGLVRAGGLIVNPFLTLTAPITTRVLAVVATIRNLKAP